MVETGGKNTMSDTKNFYYCSYFCDEIHTAEISTDILIHWFRETLIY